MGRIFALVIVLILVFATPHAFAADKRIMRWIASIYEDANGVGLSHPEGVACGAEHLFVADTGNSRLLRYSLRDQIPTPEAEFPVANSSPIILQVNSKGDLYFLDSRDRQIVIVSASGEPGGTVRPTKLPSSREVVPKSFRIGDDDRIYLLDIYSAQVLVLDPDGQYSRHIPFPEKFGFFSDLAVDEKGTIFLLDSVEATLYSATADADSFARLTENMKELMNFPTSLAIDDLGVLYLADQYGSGLALVSPDGSFRGRRLGMGWNESRLQYPSQICISEGGKLLIADRNNSRVQVFTLVGE